MHPKEMPDAAKILLFDAIVDLVEEAIDDRQLGGALTRLLNNAYAIMNDKEPLSK